MLNNEKTVSFKLEDYEAPSATITILLSNDIITVSDPFVEDIDWDL